MNQSESYFNQLLAISGSLTTYFSILPILLACFFLKNLNRPLILFFWYLVARFVLNLITILFVWSVNKYYDQFWKPLLTSLKIEDTNFFSGIFILNDIIFIGFYFSILNISNTIRARISFITIILIVFQGFNYFFIDGFRSLGTIGNIVSTCFLIILSGFYLLVISKNPPKLTITKNSFFWIAIGLFIPHIFGLFNILVVELLFKSDFVLFCKARIFRNFLQMLSEVLFMISFCFAKYQKYL